MYSTINSLNECKQRVSKIAYRCECPQIDFDDIKSQNLHWALRVFHENLHRFLEFHVGFQPIGVEQARR